MTKRIEHVSAKKDITELEKAHKLTRKGCYAGLLKEPPMPRNHKEVAATLSKRGDYSGIGPFSVQLDLGTTFCWGILALKGLKYWVPNESIEWKDHPAVSDVVFSANIYAILDKLEENNTVKWVEGATDRKEVPCGRKYVLTTLSEHMMKKPHSLHHVLTEYFGFQRLEDDFMNWGRTGGSRSDRVCLMGLGFSGFHEDEL